MLYYTTINPVYLDIFVDVLMKYLPMYYFEHNRQHSFVVNNNQRQHCLLPVKLAELVCLLFYVSIFGCSGASSTVICQQQLAYVFWAPTNTERQTIDAGFPKLSFVSTQQGSVSC